MPEIELAGGPLDGKRIKAPGGRGEPFGVRISLFAPDGDPAGPLVYELAGTCYDGVPLYRLKRPSC